MNRVFSYIYETLQEYKVIIISVCLFTFFATISVLVAFNQPGPPIKYVNGFVEVVRNPKSPTADTPAGTHIAKVRLINGTVIYVNIYFPPIPEAGDAVKLSLHEKALSGDRYQYVGTISKPI